MKIIYIPVDDRPCNYQFPSTLASSSNIKLVTPPIQLLGKRKKTADLEQLWNWVFNEIKNVDGMILSMDMLIYGGLVPSRVHNKKESDFQQYFDNIKKLKIINPQLVIYGFQLVMRCPANSSGFEEPDYYATFGKEIFTLGQLEDKEKRGIISSEELEEKNRLKEYIPFEYLEDYLNRRKINLLNNFKTIGLIKEGLFDFFIFPQDDTSRFGYSYFDQSAVAEKIKESNIMKRAIMYPGTDEIGCTLLSRMLNKYKSQKIKIYPRFSSANGPYITPLYEDRPLLETVKSTIIACGGIVVSDEISADIVFIVNSPGEKMIEAAHQLKRETDNKKNLQELMVYLEYLIEIDKMFIVGDSAHANGGDIELFNYLYQFDLLYKLSGYAGWNTNSNTLGTALAFGMFSYYYPKSKELKEFLVLRYLEDIAYSSIIRQEIKEKHKKIIGVNQANLGELTPYIEKEAKKALQIFATSFLSDSSYFVEVESCSFPWKRMFEIDINLAIKEL